MIAGDSGRTDEGASGRADPTGRPGPSGTLRPARTGDRASILEVAEASGLFPAEGLAEIGATLDASLTGTAEADHWVVDDTQGRTAAVAYYAPERMAEGTWNLYMLAVHPDHQREGRGARMVRHVERQLRAGEARILLIETSGVPEFAGQRAFYLGLGYREEARIRDFYDCDDDKVVYWKAMTSDEDQVDRAHPPSWPPGQPPSSAI